LIFFIHNLFTKANVLEYWHQRADERHGNPPSR